MRRALLLCVLLVACERPEAPIPGWQSKVAVDPMFGSGQAFVDRLMRDPRGLLRGEPEARNAFLAARTAEHDAAAAGLAAELIPAEAGQAVARFLETAAGQSMLTADATLCLSATILGAMSFEDAWSAYQDAARVGGAAKEAFAKATAAVQAGESPSPLRLAVVIAASQIREEHAPAIAEFLSTPAGRTWSAARQQAFDRSRERFGRLRGQLLEAGFVAEPEGVRDLVLPKAIFGR